MLLTPRVAAADIVAHALDTGVDAVQLVQLVTASVRQAVRQALPGVQILQVVHVEGPQAVAEAREAAKGSDYLLLDSGRPSLPVAELGGTGRIHDWSASAEIVRASPIPVFLAGGLEPGNVSAAIEAVGPDGVDLCSGIRDEEGRLEPHRLKAFMDVVAEVG